MNTGQRMAAHAGLAATTFGIGVAIIHTYPAAAFTLGILCGFNTACMLLLLRR